MKLFLINFFDSTEKPEIQIYLLVRTKDGQAKDQTVKLAPNIGQASSSKSGLDLELPYLYLWYS